MLFGVLDELANPMTEAADLHGERGSGAPQNEPAQICYETGICRWPMLY